MGVFLTLSPILIAVLSGLVGYYISAQSLQRELDKHSAPLDDAALAGTLDRLAAAAQVGRLSAHVYDIPQINGLAAPDGRIFITHGLLGLHRKGAITTEEIAGVIAHEVGHVALGHHRKRLAAITGLRAGRAVAAPLLARFIPGVWPLLLNLGIMLFQHGLSRRDEYRADAYAAALLARAGIDPRAQISLLRKLEAQSHASATAGWMRSHPPTEARIARILALAEAWEDQNSFVVR